MKRIKLHQIGLALCGLCLSVFDYISWSGISIVFLANPIFLKSNHLFPQMLHNYLGEYCIKH